MKITIERNDQAPAVLEVSDDVLQTLIDKYAYMTNLRAAEECSELSVAISKAARKATIKEHDNLVEESIDVLLSMLVMFQQYDVTSKQLTEWIEKKTVRFNERVANDREIFRNKTALNLYMDHATQLASTVLTDSRDLTEEDIDSIGDAIGDNGIIITRVSAFNPSDEKKGAYNVNGDVDALPEYFHVIFALLMEKDPDVLDYMIPEMLAAIGVAPNPVPNAPSTVKKSQVPIKHVRRDKHVPHFPKLDKKSKKEHGKMKKNKNMSR